jgi:hypothetical protein
MERMLYFLQTAVPFLYNNESFLLRSEAKISFYAKNLLKISYFCRIH